MDIGYEENLFENPFYKKISYLIQHKLNFSVESENVVLCVPRKKFVNENPIRNNAFCMSHILTASRDLPKSHYHNLNGNKVVLTGKTLNLFDFDNTRKLQVNILFEEIYYTKDLNKFKIFCIDFPLIFEYADYKNGEFFVVSSIRDAEKFLECHTNNPKLVFKKINGSILNFKSNNNKNTNLEILKENVRLHYNQCMDYILLDRKLKEKCKIDTSYMTNLKLSVEYLLMEKIYENVFDSISTFTIESSKQLNKIIRKLSEITPHDLDIDNISLDKKKLESMQLEFQKINDSKTSLDKLQFLKNAIDIFSSHKQNEKLKTVDDLLPVLVYLIIKSEFCHWSPTLTFIKEFNLAKILEQNEFGAQNFLCTTLEAVIFYIASDEIQLKPRNDPKPEIFHIIKDCKEQELVKYLADVSLNGNTSQFIDKSNNYCPLHYAAVVGSQKIFFLLLHSKLWDINAVTKRGETPLLLSAKYGHECCVKTLLYFCDHLKIVIAKNLQDVDGNTALFYASKWGFDTIIETLLEYDAKTNIRNKKNELAIANAYNTQIYNILESAENYQNYEEFPVSESEYVFLTTEDLCDDFTPVEKPTEKESQTEEVNGNFIFEEKVPNGMCHPLCSCSKCLSIIDDLKIQHLSV